jgi:predicted Rossmann fold nucleotide-binding protein DprA/Smf involved in DNA uptake
MRLIIAGGRKFDDYDLLCDETSYWIVELVGEQEEVVIISGLAKGADTLGCQFASENGYPLEGYAAEWDKYGRSAGIRRNKLMAKRADALIAFWDGESKGTMHMIDFANAMGLKVKVVQYEGT